MNSPKSIRTALCLSAPNVAALVQGQTIAAISKTFIRTGQNFALCPYDAMSSSISTQSRQVALSSPVSSQPLDVKTLTIDAWASCELCQIIDASYKVRDFVKLVNFPLEELKILLQETHHVFLVYLRVYRFSQPIDVNTESVEANRVGKFFGLPIAQNTSGSYPVLSDRIFAQRKRQLENLEPPEHPEIEALHTTIAQLTPTNPSAIHLEQDLKCFLGWAESAIVDRANTNSQWIQDIAKAGNSSDGDYFEKLVRKSFIELGFTNSRNNSKMSLDPEMTGGAGGIDFFCDAPYLVIGECKASKNQKVADHKDGAPAQLLKFGGSFLEPDEFADCIRIIMAPGQLTDYADRTANKHQMNVLQPETLQRLIELKNAYPGAINLWELKLCLSQAPFSQAADDKVNQFIDRIQEDLKVRSKIVEILQAQAPQDLGIDFIWGAYQASHPPRLLKQEQIKEILIELSSPLTGFIGRKDGDRFYFLRSFHLNTKS